MSTHEIEDLVARIEFFAKNSGFTDYEYDAEVDQMTLIRPVAWEANPRPQAKVRLIPNDERVQVVTFDTGYRHLVAAEVDLPMALGFDRLVVIITALVEDIDERRRDDALVAFC